MKKIIFGGIMMLSGILSTAILLAGTILPHDFRNLYSGFQTLEFRNFFTYIRGVQLEIPLVIFIGIAIIGFALGIWGLLEKKDN